MKTKFLDAFLWAALLGLPEGAALGQFTGNTQIGGGAPGSIVTNAPGSYTVLAGGNDIWGAFDEFTFHQFTAQGTSFDLRVRVQSLEPNAKPTKAGLMVRQSLASTSRMAFVRVTPTGPTLSGDTGANDVRFAYRTGTTSPAQGEHEDPAVRFPSPTYPNAGVRLERHGNIFGAYFSTDGVNWDLLGNQNTASWEGGAFPTSSYFLGLAQSRNPLGPKPTAQVEYRDFTTTGSFPPIITDLLDVNGVEDNPVGPFSFSFSDTDTPASGLSLSAATSNPTLVPMGNITLAGSPTPSVTVAPAPNQSGLALITVIVSDGGRTARDTFQVLFTPVNDPPTISPIQDQTINEDGATGPLAFTIGDVETPAASLTVTRASNNTTLVPLSGIVLGGTGSSRTVTVTPAANQSGTATITVSVNDSAATVDEVFILTVNPLNDLPTISPINDLAINEDGTTGPLAFTIGDVETPAASLTVTRASNNTTLAPLSGIVLGGTGSSRTVTVTPATNQSGTATITVSANDGAANVDEVFILTVNPLNDLPTISPINDLAINEDGTTGPLAFTIGDVETPAASLTVTRVSNNTSLVPLSGIVLGGTGSSRTVTVTPAANQSGTATITVSVNDGSATVDEVFILTVNPQPPVIVSPPMSLTVSPGDPAIFSVAATGSPPLSYQWRRGSANIPGATGSTHTIPSAQPSDAGDYSVVVTNPGGSTTSPPATLTVRQLDFGDAPQSYPTLLAHNGARHVILQFLRLGVLVDGEADGLPSLDALGDDGPAPAADDEDGVRVVAPLVPGQEARVEVATTATARLDAWVDFNANGSWAETNEHIFISLLVPAGTVVLPFDVPSAAVPGPAYARFRLSQQGGLSYDGLALDGEVEDYRLEIEPNQLCNQDCHGTEFWLAFPGNYAPDPADPPQLTLCILGPEGASGTVDIDGLGFHAVFDTPALVVLPSTADLGEASDRIENKGIHVRSDAPVSIYPVNHVANSTDGYLALPTPILGTEYLVQGFGNVHTGIPEANGTQFALVACEDDTHIDFTLPFVTGNNDAFVPFTRVLQRGQTFQLRNFNDAPADLSGTIISATKPVAVFGSHACAMVPSDQVFFCDYLVEQLQPTHTWGRTFLTSPLFSREEDTFRVQASAPATDVFIDGVYATTLERGQSHQFTLADGARITGSAPISVMQYANSSDHDGVVDSDPFMMIVPAVSMYGSNQVVCTAPIGFPAANYINIVAPDAAVFALSVRVDGILAGPGSFTSIPGTGYSYAQWFVFPGIHTVSASQPVGVTVYGWGEYDSYGYPGCFYFGDTAPPQLTCPGDIVVVLGTQPGQPCTATVPDLRSQVRFEDNCEISPNAFPTQSPAPGTLVRPGVHPIRLSVADARGNVGTCVTALTVLDPSPLVIPTPSNRVVRCISPLGAVVRFEVRAESRCDTNLPVACMPPSGSLFPPGTNLVQCLATNQFGASASASFYVVVRCLEGPISIIPGTPGTVVITWPVGGVLETAPTVNGPWRELDETTIPATINVTDRQAFFRARFD